MLIEDIVLTHSQRGMDVLRQHMPNPFITESAKRLYSLERKNILLATGFYVAGYAETDGPPGTFYLAKALKKLGFNPIIVTDEPCRDFFNDDSIEVLYLKKGFDANEVLEKYSPVSLISIERCGENIKGDYANMRGISIADNTVEIDHLFDVALDRGIYTIGVGDGGNEIGMGNMAEIISSKLSLVPCKTKVEDLIIATISNWGAFALCAELSLLEGKNLFADFDEIFAYLQYIVSKGSVDGVKKEHIATVDGYDISVEKEVIDNINKYLAEKL